MAKKKSVDDSGTHLNFIFPANLPDRVEEPQVEPVPEPEVAPSSDPELQETSTDLQSPEILSDPKIDPENGSIKCTYPDITKTDDTAKTPQKENGVLLCIVLCILILISLGFLIYHETSWRTHEENNETIVNNEFEELTSIIKNYISTVKDPNKEKYCQELRQLYIAAANASNNDINAIFAGLLEQSRRILGFYNRPEALSNEYEWHKLFCKSGIIDKWLDSHDVVVTPANKKQLFMAIAEGLRL